MNETTTQNTTPRPRRQRPKRDAAYYYKRARQYHNGMLIFTFVLIVLIFAIANLIHRDRGVSENENRKLAQRPKFSVSALADGSYFSGVTSWFNDQFVGRDGWITMNLGGQKLLGRRESGDVYLGRKGYLLKKPASMNAETVEAKTEAIREFATSYPDVRMYFTLAPSAASILTDKVPRNAPLAPQLDQIQTVYTHLGTVTPLDITTTLQRHKDEYIYYKTDHHWTSLGARYAFEAVSVDMDLAAVSEYDVHTVSTTFRGTQSSESGDRRSKDTIQVYTPKDVDVSYLVTIPSTQEKSASMYKREALDTKDQYTVFFGGNYPLVEIGTTANAGRCLLMFKDSYANCFIQFLTPYFDKIIMIDPRYYYDDLTSVITTQGVTDVLFLYCADTFMEDTSLTDVLNSVLTTLNAEAASAPADAEDADAEDAADQNE